MLSARDRADAKGELIGRACELFPAFRSLSYTPQEMNGLRTFG